MIDFQGSTLDTADRFQRAGLQTLKVCRVRVGDPVDPLQALPRLIQRYFAHKKQRPPRILQ